MKANVVWMIIGILLIITALYRSTRNDLGPTNQPLSNNFLLYFGSFVLLLSLLSVVGAA